MWLPYEMDTNLWEFWRTWGNPLNILDFTVQQEMMAVAMVTAGSVKCANHLAAV